MSFKKFISEEAEKFGKLNHLEHVEDHVFNGEDSYNKAVESLKAAHDRITGKPTKSKLTIKYDGSPSIVFGHDSKTQKFFVGTKSVFNEKPKLNFSEKDIRKNHDDSDLRRKLHHALEHLPKITPQKGIYQGDMMYTKDRVHEDSRHYHFTPNTIMYSVKKTDPEGEKIRQAKLGIVIHTKYHGKDLKTMHAGFDPGLHEFRNHKDVHVIDPELKLQKSINDEDMNNQFLKHMNDAENELNNAHPDTFDDVAVHTQHLKKYINKTVKNNEKPTAVGFKAHLTDQYKNEAEKLKTPAGKLRKKEQLLNHLSHVDENHDKYQSILAIHHHLQQAKNVLIDSLKDSNPFESSIDGKESKGEGYVVTHNGYPSKLVDRQDFSKKNFQHSQNKKQNQ